MTQNMEHYLFMNMMITDYLPVVMLITVLALLLLLLLIAYGGLFEKKPIKVMPERANDGT